jgi:hypothetical protein
VLQALAAVLAAVTAPIGVFGTTLARFDRDTLRPVGPQTQIREPHAPGRCRRTAGCWPSASPPARRQAASPRAASTPTTDGG